MSVVMKMNEMNWCYSQWE